MVDIKKLPCGIEVIAKGEKVPAEVTFKGDSGNREVYLDACGYEPEFIVLRWNGVTETPVHILGDAWERAYANLSWRGIETNRYMPWYFIVSDLTEKCCCGVKTGCNSFVSFRYDCGGITALIDVRNGTGGVKLGGRILHVCTLVCRSYPAEISEFEALKSFCRVMCDNPIFPKMPVYGGNNWYYAYGKSSYEEIIEDTKLQVMLSQGNENRPYMVIDDCWQVNSCAGPWRPNEKFRDMAALASEIKALGAIPGIWVRFLKNLDSSIPDSWHLHRDGEPCLDISIPEVLDFIKEDIKLIKSWGYELIKHDFSTYDLFHSWGKDMGGTVVKGKQWSFSDMSKTNAELVLDLYRAIREAAGDAVVIGCNTVSHLSAGLVEINRTGDDTSGKSWKRTRDYGVNTLAFRLPQHGAFYDVDADCVGILEDNIPWSLNRQWLRLLAQSGTPLFVSCPNRTLSDEMLRDLRQAYSVAALRTGVAQPLDWMYNIIPRIWLLDGEKVCFDWMKENAVPEV